MQKDRINVVKKMEIEDKELYKRATTKLPGQKEQLDVFRNQLKQITDIIEEGKEEFRQGIMTEFEYAGFMRESKGLMQEIKKDVQNYKDHIDTMEDFVYLYEEYNEYFSD